MPSGERRGRVGPVRFRTFLRNTVLDVMRSRGWLETDSDLGWDFFWADVGWVREMYDHVRLDDTQRINHFRNHFELTRKDSMVRNLKRMRKSLEREGRVEEALEFDFFPITFTLPQDYGLFEMEFRRQPNAIWIMKPPAKAQGKGIFLFSKISQIAEWRKDYKQRQGGVMSEKPGGGGGGCNMYGSEQVEPYLAQRYIDNPHLVGGKKYDIRIYVLVTSYSPLVVWLHRSGFARFCHQRFSLKDIENTFIHVTNVAVQKTNPNYTPSFGCKYGLRNLRQYITASRGVEAAQKVFDDIQNMILRSLLAVQKIITHDKHCFELYGYDIMVDDNLHPWLIETNASPSLSAETPADYHLKFNMLEDMFNVVDIEKRRTGEEVRVGGFDLIWKNGPVGPTRHADGKSAGLTQSFLGCANEFEIPIMHMRMPPRLQQLDSNERLLT